MAWPEYYTGARAGRFALVGSEIVDHADHCLNAMRETITCQADTTPNVWRSERADHDEGGSHESIARYNTVHTCRNYGAIQEWAHKHSMPHPPGPDDFNSSLPHHLLPTREQLVQSGLLKGIEY